MVKKLYLGVFVLIVTASMLAAGTMAWFTSSANAPAATFTAGTVSIAANQSFSFQDDEWLAGDILPKMVVSKSQGLRKDGLAILQNRSNPSSVLAKGGEFFSLGFTGHVTVEFYEKIVPGDTIAVVVEVTGGSYPLEKAEVFVSMDNQNWFPIGEVSNATGGGYYKTSSILVPELLDGQPFPISYARYIKLEDRTDSTLVEFPGDADGFDVDAIYVQGAYRSATMNWNPGDRSPVSYTVVNTGSKSVHLRATFSGNWYQYNETTYSWIPWTPVPDKGVVTFNLPAGSGWVEYGGKFYYDGTVAGTYGAPTTTSVPLPIIVCLAGEDTDNEYQGKRFVLNAQFEAIQSSNGAAAAQGWSFIPQN